MVNVCKFVLKFGRVDNFLTERLTNSCFSFFGLRLLWKKYYGGFFFFDIVLVLLSYAHLFVTKTTHLPALNH